MLIDASAVLIRGNAIRARSRPSVVPRRLRGRGARHEERSRLVRRAARRVQRQRGDRRERLARPLVRSSGAPAVDPRGLRTLLARLAARPVGMGTAGQASALLGHADARAAVVSDVRRGEARRAQGRDARPAADARQRGRRAEGRGAQAATMGRGGGCGRADGIRRGVRGG